MDDYPSEAMTSPPPDMGSLGLATPGMGVRDEEPEPEAGIEELISDDMAEQGNVEGRLAMLNKEIGDAVASQDFARAWRLQKEIEMTQKLKVKLAVFDEKIAVAFRAMHEAASGQRFMEAEQYKEEIDALKTHKKEIADIESEIARLEIQSLVHATNPEGGLQAALGVKSQIDGMQAKRAQAIEREERLAVVRQELRDAVLFKNYARAEQLKNQLATMRSDTVPLPQYQPSTTSPAPVFSHTLPAPAPPPHNDVVTNLATLIWQTSLKDGEPAIATQQPPISSPIDHESQMRYKRRLMNFYQKYNPSKLPSVTSCLQEYRGHEERLFQALVEKYGPEPPDWHRWKTDCLGWR
eukprot:TRINITY_DN2996_c0_g1_i4.p1 TRINITY_DN2996_c0_g1~~TRINITY_DN2996_c0_g1_i4.p1  ORF type:complete len:374 (+),score=60.83 TRINITY_DN2996_c0_g1_i4:69-1124(+)